MGELDNRRYRYLDTLLRPVLRFCLRASIRYPELIERIKALLIEFAQDEIRNGNQEVTISRMSVMTGINRRDLTRVYREGARSEHDTAVSLVARVIATWEQDGRFLTKTRQPRVLTFRGNRNDFRKLVESVSKDVKPATLLFELERLGYIKHTDNGLALIKRIDHYTGDPDKGLKLLAHDVEHLCQAVEENLFRSSNVRNLHLHTEYDNIFLPDIPKIRLWLLEQGADLHRRTREFLSLHDKDVNPNSEKPGHGRIVLGSFSWTTPPE